MAGTEGTSKSITTTDAAGQQVTVSYTEGSLVNARKQRLHTVEYLPAKGPVNGIVLWHHGLGEHIGRYTHVFPKLAAAGVAVHGYDAHGHGHSEPKEDKRRAFLDNFMHLIEDYELCLDGIRQLYASKGAALPPVVAAGQSLGGLVAAYAVARNPAGYAGLVLHSALIDVEWTPVLRAQAPFGACLGACIPFAKIVPAVRPQDMSQDPQAVQAFLDDPLIYHGMVKARTGSQTLNAFRAMQKMSCKISVPIYACHGTSDKTTSLEAVQRLMAASCASDKTFKEIQGGYHELLMGPEKEECTATMVAWVTEHVTAAAAAGTGNSAAAADKLGTAAAAPAALNIVATASSAEIGTAAAQ